MKASHLFSVFIPILFSCSKDRLQRQDSYTQYSIRGKVISNQSTCSIMQQPTTIELITPANPSFAPDNIVHAFNLPDSLKVPNQYIKLDFDPVYNEQYMEKDCNGNIIPQQVSIINAVVD